MLVELIGGPDGGRWVVVPPVDRPKTSHILVGYVESDVHPPLADLTVVPGGGWDLRICGRHWPIYRLDPDSSRAVLKLPPD